MSTLLTRLDLLGSTRIYSDLAQIQDFQVRSGLKLKSSQIQDFRLISQGGSYEPSR